MRLLRSDVCGRARLHWGKAGHAEHAPCFDGAAEYGDAWCDFGCAVQALDPGSKFESEAGTDVWQWHARTRGSNVVPRFADCCTGAGLDRARCECARRPACK